MSSYDALITLSADAFADAVGELFVGAPVVELADVLDPYELVQRVIREQAEHLSLTVFDRGRPWVDLCMAVLTQYEDTHALTGDYQ